MNSEFTPGERAVLNQIRALYASVRERHHQLKALTMQWPPMHYEAYKSSFDRLVARRLIAGNGPVFVITDSGLSALGVASARAQGG